MKTITRASPDRTNWFEHFFHGVANDLWRKCVTTDQTEAEADFLEKALGKATRLLDVPCGNGRHCLELARRGKRMTGIDLSEEFIAEARAGAKAGKLRVDFIHGDMRRLRLPAKLDGAFCMGNSFGYFDHSGVVQFVRGIARVLKPKARIVLETGCVAETLLPSLKERGWYQVQDILFAIENRYLPDISCLETEATFVQNGKTEVRKFWHRVYTAAEIQRLLQAAGLATLHLYGSLDGQPFKMGDQRLLLVAERRT
jgi:SAM-dependent methyltransferase